MTEGSMSCLDYAMQGEKHIKARRLEEGISCLEKAIEVGTNNATTLSAIYSQLGNAYLELRNFKKAQEYLTYDRIITKMLKDIEGEAKAASNLSNLYKLQNDYDNAAKEAQIQLNLARSTIEAMALYNLGSIYLFRGKEAGKSYRAALSNVSMCSLVNTSGICAYKDDINQAIAYFKAHLEIVERHDNRRTAGMTYGNLGICYYVLKDFHQSVEYHKKRLEVAQEYGDKEQQRRAYSNLGNAFLFLEEIPQALECYRLALSLAMELDMKKVRNKVVQAQALFNLASASTLAKDFEMAATYHLRHLALAREIGDRAGEARGHASLATVYRHMSDYPKVAYFLARRRSIAKEMRDPGMVHSAEIAFKELIELAGESIAPEGEIIMDSSADPEADRLPSLRLTLSLTSINDIGDCGLSRRDIYASDSEISARPSSKMNHGERDFFEELMRLQSKRMDEQRCDAPILTDISNRALRQRDTTIPSPSASISSRTSRWGRPPAIGTITKNIWKHMKPSATSTPFLKKTKTISSSSSFVETSSIQADDDRHSFKAPLPMLPENRRHSICMDMPLFATPIAPPRKRRDNPDALIDQLMQAQARRMDEQRANLLPGLQGREDLLNKIQETTELEGADEQLLELVARVQGQRMNEQRSELGGTPKEPRDESEKAPTIPEDDLAELVARMAKTRLEEQRALLPD